MSQCDIPFTSKGNEVVLRLFESPSLRYESLYFLYSTFLNFLFSNWSKLFNRYNKYINRLGINSLSACLHFIVQHNFYDKIVVGVDNQSQLEHLAASLTKDVQINALPDFSSNNKNLINPSMWSAL